MWMWMVEEGGNKSPGIFYGWEGGEREMRRLRVGGRGGGGLVFLLNLVWQKEFTSSRI